MPSTSSDDVAEAARLRAVAVDRERLAAQRLHDEVRDDAAVARPHARAVGVEDADDARVDAVVAVVRHRDRLGEALRLVVDAARADGVHVAPVVLRLRMHERIAVHLGRRREEEARALRLGEAERVVRAERADLERLDRQLEIVDRAGRRREVQHAVERTRDVGERRDVVLDELEPLVADQVRDVVRVAGDEVVEADDLVALGEEAVARGASRGSPAAPVMRTLMRSCRPRPIDAVA